MKVIDLPLNPERERTSEGYWRSPLADIAEITLRDPIPNGVTRTVSAYVLGRDANGDLIILKERFNDDQKFAEYLVTRTIPTKDLADYRSLCHE